MADSFTDADKNQSFDLDGAKRVKFETRRYKIVKVFRLKLLFSFRLSKFLITVSIVIDRVTFDFVLFSILARWLR